jgi:peptidoglycan L-alanyl-D-glutamate endopeptidase CwlK
MFILGKQSKENLKGVDPYLIAVVVNAIRISSVDFTVREGLRSIERQKQLYAQGRTVLGNIVTWTLKSKHIDGEAVDLYPFVDGKVLVDDSIETKKKFVLIRNAMFNSATLIGVKIRWGRDWDSDGNYEEKGEYDGPHFELV